MKLEIRVLKAIKHLKDSRTMPEWTQAIHEYNRAQERYSKYHNGVLYQPHEAVNTPERHYYD